MSRLCKKAFKRFKLGLAVDSVAKRRTGHIKCFGDLRLRLVTFQQVPVQILELYSWIVGVLRKKHPGTFDNALDMCY